MRKNEIVFAGILSAITVICFYFRIFYGWDHDESYNILLAQRIADGKILFKDMWDLHQTAALFPAILCRIYVLLNGSTAGIAVFLRAMSVIVQIVLTVIVYSIIKRYYGVCCALGAGTVIANMLPRATQELEYSTISVWSCLVCALLLLEIRREGFRLHKLLWAAFFYAVAVYSYPTIVITVPFVAFLIVFIVSDERKQGLKYALLFFTLCAALACVLMIYLFSKMSVSEFIRIIHELGKNGDHSNWFNAFTNADYIIKSGVRLLVLGAAAFLFSLMLKIVFKFDLNVVYSFVLLTTLLVVILNVTGLRPSGPFGLLERYIGAAILMFFIGIKNEDKDFVWIFGGFGIAVYLGVLMGSNLGFNENAMYLESALICLIVLLIKKLDDYSEGERKLALISAWVFIIGIVFTSGYFVRIDSTEPANVTQCSSTIANGPLKGIKVFEEQNTRFERQWASVSSHTEYGKLYTILTREPIEYYFVNGDYISAQYAATGQYYNEQWVDFYTLFERKLPDNFLVNKADVDDISRFYKTEFGQWVMSEYEENPSQSDDSYWVLDRK